MCNPEIYNCVHLATRYFYSVKVSVRKVECWQFWHHSSMPALLFYCVVHLTDPPPPPTPKKSKFLLDYVDCSFIASDLFVLHSKKQNKRQKKKKEILQAGFAKMKLCCLRLVPTCQPAADLRQWWCHVSASDPLPTRVLAEGEESCFSFSVTLGI